MMTAAVTNSPKAAARSAAFGLAAASAAGAAFLIGCAVAVFWGVPQLWANLAGGPPASMMAGAGMFLVMLVALAALAFVGLRIAGRNPPAGIRAGMATVISLVCASFGLAVGVGRTLLSWQVSQPIGLAITAGLFVLLLFFGFRWLASEKGRSFLLAFEHQGWFHTGNYKRNQGQRVRRFTILGVLALFGWGLAALWSSGTLKSMGTNWTADLPFTDYRLILLPAVKYTLPVLLLGAGLWLAWRLVSFPLFADFLIAVDAEMNKVS